jgi:hypothetical protein
LTTIVRIVFTDGNYVSLLPPSPVNQQVYLYNTTTLIITESYHIGGRTITNVIGRIVKAENNLNLYLSASLQERRINLQGAVLKVLVEHNVPYLEIKNIHALSKQEIIRKT